MTSSQKLFAALFAFALSSAAAYAQTCSRVLESKNGKVYSANPGNITADATSDQVTIKFKKTDGRAEAQVNFYLDNTMQTSKTINLDNGNWTDNNWRVVTITGAAGKEVKVKVVNQSATNTISYSCIIEGNSTSLVTTGQPATGTLVGQQNKTIYTLASCTGKTRITITRTSGQARANIRVWEKIGSTWRAMDTHNRTFEQRDNNDNFVVNSDKELKIELRNVSVGNTIGYSMNATVSN